MNQDLNQLPQVNYVSVVDIKILAETKIRARDLLVRRYGEEFYQRILNSPIPFIYPLMNGRVIYLYIFL